MKNFKGEIRQKVSGRHEQQPKVFSCVMSTNLNRFIKPFDSLKKLGGTPASLDNSSYLRLFRI